MIIGDFREKALFFINFFLLRIFEKTQNFQNLKKLKTQNFT